MILTRATPRRRPIVQAELPTLNQTKDGWHSWSHNAMIEYLVAGSDLKMRFRCNDGHAGWIKPMTGSIDETIRRQLRNMSNGHTN